MKWFKFITRKYTLLEHSLIIGSVSEENNAGKGPYYTGVLDISKKGLVDIYVSEKDIERNKKFILDSSRKDPLFFQKHLKNGTKAVKEISDIPKSLLKEIKNLSDKQIVKELLKLKKKFYNFGVYIDFIHYVERSGVNLSRKYINKFSKFNDWRKDIFMNFLNFIVLLSKEIAKKKKIKSHDLSYLTFSELILFLDGKISAKDADILQEERKEKYIFEVIGKKEKIISDDFDKEFEKIKKDLADEIVSEEIRGIPINKGIIKGNVKIIFQTTSLKDVPKGMVIVTHQTKPDMTPMLKGAIAIVTDEGGLLCHAANIAREFNILGVVGTKNATKVLKDGDLVEVDAHKGIVRKIK